MDYNIDGTPPPREPTSPLPEDILDAPNSDGEDPATDDDAGDWYEPVKDDYLGG